MCLLVLSLAFHQPNKFLFINWKVRSGLPQCRWLHIICFLLLPFFSITLLSFHISTVIQNVTHRPSTKSPDRTPLGGTILGESILKSIPRLNKSGYFFFIIEPLWNFALWADLLNWCWFISFQYLTSWLCLFQAKSQEMLPLSKYVRETTLAHASW